MTSEENKLIENLSAEWEQLPIRQPFLINGLLRRFEIMTIIGPRRSLKSSLAIELALAVANGGSWLGYHCQKGNVLYINLDKEKYTILSHFERVHAASGLSDDAINSIDVIHLNTTVFSNASLLFAQIKELTQGRNYMLTVIDSMDLFNNKLWSSNNINQELNSLAASLGGSIALIKSANFETQGDHETLKTISQSEEAYYSEVNVSFIELELTKAKSDTMRLEPVKKYAIEAIREANEDYYKLNIDETFITYLATVDKLRNHLSTAMADKLGKEDALTKFDEIDNKAKHQTYWRILVDGSGIPPISAKNYIFNYPTIKADSIGWLESTIIGKVNSNAGRPTESDNQKLRKKEERCDKFVNELDEFIKKNEHNPTKTELAKFMKVDVRTITNRLTECQELDYQILHDGKTIKFV